MKNKILSFGLVLISSPAFCEIRDTIIYNTPVFDPDRNKVIPDKVFEFGIPLLFMVILLNAIITVLKNRADHQLKLKMIEKVVSEETLVNVFRESNAIVKMQPLKYFLFAAAIGLSLILIHLLQDFLRNQSGYLAIGIVLLFTSIASYIYYDMLRKKL